MPAKKGSGAKTSCCWAWAGCCRLVAEHRPRGTASNKFQAWLDKGNPRGKGCPTSGSVGQACSAEKGGPKWAGLALSKLEG
ncbi:hypothetical protein ACFX15_018147 [Malus domestica]